MTSRVFKRFKAAMSVIYHLPQNDHWTAKGHKQERNNFVINFAEYAHKTHTRVTFLSGDVHCAAVGYFKTFVKEKKAPDVPPDVDHRYILNVITST